MRYAIEYPSGHRFELVGRLALVPCGPEGVVPVVVDPVRRVVSMIDPRAIVLDDAGTFAYHPRTPELEHVLAPWVVEWLGDHLAWAT